MAKSTFSANSYWVRLAMAIALVFATFNPVEPYSYFYWAVKPLFSGPDSFNATKGLVGIMFIIGWTIFLRATLRSLGTFGILLAVSFFGLLLWLIVDKGWIDGTNQDVMVWLILLALSCVLATGVSWSHIRRRLTGLVDVDDTDD